jgi:hypothetical protein
VLHLQPDASRLRWFDAEGRRIDVAGTTTTGA